MTIDEFMAFYDRTRNEMEQSGFVFTDSEFDINKELLQLKNLRALCERSGFEFPDENDPLTYDASSFDMRSYIAGCVESARTFVPRICVNDRIKPADSISEE